MKPAEVRNIWSKFSLGVDSLFGLLLLVNSDVIEVL